MSTLSADQVKEIAHLARIAVDDTALAGYAQDLTNILDLVEQMQAVDTDGVEALANPLDATQRLRSDAVTESNQREHFQTVAPLIEDGLYLVPQVIE